MRIQQEQAGRNSDSEFKVLSNLKWTMSSEILMSERIPQAKMMGRCSSNSSGPDSRSASEVGSVRENGNCYSHANRCGPARKTFVRGHLTHPKLFAKSNLYQCKQTLYRNLQRGCLPIVVKKYHQCVKRKCTDLTTRDLRTAACSAHRRPARRSDRWLRWPACLPEAG